MSLTWSYSQGTGHDRSLLERCVGASGAVHRLTEQYRMHERICAVVSRLFYNSMLQTPASVRDDRQRKEKRPLVWLSVRGSETIPPKTKSYVNYEEISAVCRVVAKLREKHPAASIAALTFYKGQLQELMRATPAALQVEVLTVDSCQGSEFDYVVLSTVRANRNGSIGFVKDKQRINVAISRSLYGLVVVGDDGTLAHDNDWAQVRAACECNVVADWQPAQALPAAGTFETVLDQLRGLQMRKREEALAQQEVDAEKLMQQQPSFRGKPGAGPAGKHASPGYTVIGGGGAKSAAALGRAAAKGAGARESRDRFNGGCGRGRAATAAGRPPRQSFDFAVEDFPDLDEGTEMILKQPKKVACKRHGMYGCAQCGLQTAPALPAHGSCAPPHGTPASACHQPSVNWLSEDDTYGSEVPWEQAATGAAFTAASGRLRIDKAAAARFVAHGIGYSGPMPASSSKPDSAGQSSSWNRAMQLSKDKRLESASWGLRAPQSAATLVAPGAAASDGEWHTCGDCGVEGDALEPDCDNPGTFYCLDCWQKWESGGDAPAAVAAAGGGSLFAMDPNMKEEGLYEIFVQLGAGTVQQVLQRFDDVDNRLERAFNVLLEMGDEKGKCYDDEFASDAEEEADDARPSPGTPEPLEASAAAARACGECAGDGLSDSNGRVDPGDGVFYCNECWARFEGGGGGADSHHVPATTSPGDSAIVAPPGGAALALGKSACRAGGASLAGGRAAHAMQRTCRPDPPAAVPSIADKAAQMGRQAQSAIAVPQSSEVCFECGTEGLGRVDDLDGNFYCDLCWARFVAAAGMEADNFWGPGPPDAPSTLTAGHRTPAGMVGAAGGRGGDAAAVPAGDEGAERALHRWAHASVVELLPSDAAYVDPDVVVRWPRARLLPLTLPPPVLPPPAIPVPLLVTWSRARPASAAALRSF
jgi:hypothetical protein